MKLGSFKLFTEVWETSVAGEINMLGCWGGLIGEKV